MCNCFDTFAVKKESLPCLGIAQMGEVARRSRVGGGERSNLKACPPQSLRDSSPIPYGTGEPFSLSECFLNGYTFFAAPVPLIREAYIIRVSGYHCTQKRAHPFG